MGSQSTALAEQFQQVNDDLLSILAGVSEQQWRTPTPDEGWTVGVVAHHIAVANPLLAGVVQAIAEGQQIPPLTMDDIHRGNAQHAEEYANCDQQETIALVRSGAAAVDLVRPLTDEQLARKAELFGREWTAAEFAEQVWIGHPRGHLDSIRRGIA